MMYTSITDFLEENNFNKIDDYNCSNEKCKIIIVTDGEIPFYIVRDNDKENGDDWYSDNLNIYTLIGYLTYYGYMNKNYNQLNHE